MDSSTIISENSANTMNKPIIFEKTGLGARFKSAREAMHLTVKEAAARLHLNINILMLIEDENFNDGPPVTFMRGYLRSYAKLLNLPEHEIIDTLKQLENAIPPTVMPTPGMPFKPAKDNERYLQWLTYVIVLVLLTLVCVWWSSHSKYAISDVPPAHTAEATPAAATPITQTPTTATTAATAAPIATTEQTTPAPPPVAAPMTTAATPPAGTTAPVAPTTVAPTATPTTSTPVTPTAAAIASATVATDAAAAEKPAKSDLSKMRMVLPEPDVDN